MGFFNDVFSNPASYALGPVIGAASSLKSASDKRKEARNNQSLDLYNESLATGARESADAKKKQFYGNTLDSLGGETESYVSKLKSGLDKNVAEADLFNQQQATQRGLQNTKAGLSGVDTTALNEQSRRNAAFGAASINEAAKRNALDLYGTSISNRMEGANAIDATEMQLAIAQMKQPQMQNNPGLIGQIFGGFV